MLEQMKTIITEYVDVDPEEITPDARFIEDLHFNSYDFMSFLGDLEDRLDVMIDEQEVMELHTVGDAITYLESLQSK